MQPGCVSCSWNTPSSGSTVSFKHIVCLHSTPKKTGKSPLEFTLATPAPKAQSRPVGGFDRGASGGSALRAQYLLKLARLEHLHHDVRTADELALDIELGDGRPVAVILDALADGLVLQHIDGH